MERVDPNQRLLYGAYNGNLDMVRQAVSEGADIECAEAGTELTALHLAVGRGFVDIAAYLLDEAGAAIRPDGHGRWPSVIAAQCGASEEMCDFIAERERAVAADGSGSGEAR